MGQTLRRLGWVWKAAIAALWLASLLGFHHPGAGMNWLVSAEVFLTNHVPDPILFAFLTGLLISTWILPAVWERLKHRLAPAPLDNALSLPTMHVTDIAEYLLNDSAWGWRQYLALSLRRFVKDHVRDEMRRAGREYQVRYLGSPPNSDATIEIGRAYWQHATFDDSRIWDRRSRFFTRVLETGAPIHGGTQAYQHGSAPHADVQKTWPRASFFLRLWVMVRIWIRKARNGFPKYLDEQSTTKEVVTADGDVVDFIVPSAEEKAMDQLLLLRKVGISHRNRKLSSEDEFTEWRTSFETWRQDVVASAKILSPSLENLLSHLDQMRPIPSDLPIFNDEHGRLVTFMSEMLLRMQQFLEKHVVR
jgi:hypothetical protein